MGFLTYLFSFESEGRAEADVESYLVVASVQFCAFLDSTFLVVNLRPKRNQRTQ